jgi:hypothetical protein
MTGRVVLPRQCTRRHLLVAGLGLPALVVACRSNRGSRSREPTALDGEGLAQMLLRQRPFAPMDVSLFDPSAYSVGPPLVPASGAVAPDEPIEAELGRVLAARPSPGAALTTGLATYASETARRLCPDTRLRAALAALAGTLGEPASTSLLESGDWERIIFGPLERGVAIAEAVTLGGESRRTMIVSDRYRSESPEALAPVLAHEALHHDEVASGEFEEAVAYALYTLVYAQFVRDNPSLVGTGTELIRALNTNLLIRLNPAHPGEAGLRVFAADNRPVLPGSRFREPDVASFFNLTYAWETRGNPLLAAYLALLANPGVTPPDSPRFDLATLRFIDDNLNPAVLSAQDLVVVARSLRLAVPAEPGRTGRR